LSYRAQFLRGVVDAIALVAGLRRAEDLRGPLAPGIQGVVETAQFGMQAGGRNLAGCFINDMTDFVGCDAWGLRFAQRLGDSDIIRLATASEYCPTHVTSDFRRSRRNCTNWRASSRLCDFVQCFTR
jgi:hypothetical protein